MAAGADYDKDNIFAKIIRGEIPSYKVFETEHCIAILDAFPMAPGHSLLIPKAEGASDALGMSEESAQHTLKELPRLCRLVKKATGCEAVNVMSNCGAVSLAFSRVFYLLSYLVG